MVTDEPATIAPNRQPNPGKRRTTGSGNSPLAIQARQGDTGAYGPHPFERNRSMLGIAAAALFFIAFLINAADITTNDVFTSSNVMLLGLMLLALQVAGIGSGWSGRRR
ncbi:hypothetical protein ABZ137_41625 [Streptomyces bobili]|uniref:hypothetical protein n=1 Tax=Streptomyces bobili TaxID=67280 RepID=UPI0033ADE0BC